MVVAVEPEFDAARRRGRARRSRDGGRVAELLAHDARGGVLSGEHGRGGFVAEVVAHRVDVARAERDRVLAAAAGPRVVAGPAALRDLAEHVGAGRDVGECVGAVRGRGRGLQDFGAGGVQQLDRPAAQARLARVVDAAAVGVVELSPGDRAAVGLDPHRAHVVLQRRVDRFRRAARHPHLAEGEAGTEVGLFEDRREVQRSLAEAAAGKRFGGRRVRRVGQEVAAFGRAHRALLIRRGYRRAFGRFEVAGLRTRVWRGVGCDGRQRRCVGHPPVDHDIHAFSAGDVVGDQHVTRGAAGDHAFVFVFPQTLDLVELEGQERVTGGRFTLVGQVKERGGGLRVGLAPAAEDVGLTRRDTAGR